jgi:phosphotransferase system HPr (HPr) family protein
MITSALSIRRVQILHPLGLHLRPAGQFAEMARRFAAEVWVRRDETEVDGKSVLSLLCLAAGPGATLELVASGQDADQAVEALADLLLCQSHRDGAGTFP